MAFPDSLFTDPGDWEPRPAPQPDPWAWTEQGLLLFDFELIRLLKPQKVLVERLESTSPGWPHRTSDERPRKGLPEASALLKHDSDYVEYYPRHPLPEHTPTWITRAWLEILGKQFMPYDRHERLLKCSDAFAKLASEIQFWVGEYNLHRRREEWKKSKLS